MTTNDYIKLPRLYVDQELQENDTVSFGLEQVHYLKNVIRRKEGNKLRLFNGRQGEWLATLNVLGKKAAEAQNEKQLLPQPAPRAPVHLAFAPIKKSRMDFLIEKAVELGVTHLHTVLTRHTENRKINAERINQQIIEATEQCERLDIPVFSGPVEFQSFIDGWAENFKIKACVERQDVQPLNSQDIKEGTAFLVGPEGGFSEAETETLFGHDKIIPVSLGPEILRAETACLLALSSIKIWRIK